MNSRLRSLGRKLADLRVLLKGPPRPLVVVANVPERATPGEAAAILDEAQARAEAQAEALDALDRDPPVLRIALEGEPTNHVEEVDDAEV